MRRYPEEPLIGSFRVDDALLVRRDEAVEELFVLEVVSSCHVHDFRLQNDSRNELSVGGEGQSFAWSVYWKQSPRVLSQVLSRARGRERSTTPGSGEPCGSVHVHRQQQPYGWVLCAP